MEVWRGVLKEDEVDELTDCYITVSTLSRVTHAG